MTLGSLLDLHSGLNFLSSGTELRLPTAHCRLDKKCNTPGPGTQWLRGYRQCYYDDPQAGVWWGLTSSSGNTTRAAPPPRPRGGRRRAQ